MLSSHLHPVRLGSLEPPRLRAPNPDGKPWETIGICTVSHNHGSGKWLCLKGNCYWRDPFLTSMMMGGSVNICSCLDLPTWSLLRYWNCIKNHKVLRHVQTIPYVQPHEGRFVHGCQVNQPVAMMQGPWELEKKLGNCPQIPIPTWRAERAVLWGSLEEPSIYHNSLHLTEAAAATCNLFKGPNLTKHST